MNLLEKILQMYFILIHTFNFVPLGPPYAGFGKPWLKHIDQLKPRPRPPEEPINDHVQVRNFIDPSNTDTDSRQEVLPRNLRKPAEAGCWPRPRCDVTEGRSQL